MLSICTSGIGTIAQVSKNFGAGKAGEMERETGIEPATSSLGSWRSTAELLPLDWVSIAHVSVAV
jgi:hypothetical protein